jgi:hypothetical protein
MNGPTPKTLADNSIFAVHEAHCLKTTLFCRATNDGRPPGGEPLWNVPKDLVIFSAIARKAKYGVKQAAPGNYRTRCFAHRCVRRLFIRARCQQT